MKCSIVPRSYRNFNTPNSACFRVLTPRPYHSAYPRLRCVHPAAGTRLFSETGTFNTAHASNSVRRAQRNTTRQAFRTADPRHKPKHKPLALGAPVSCCRRSFFFFTKLVIFKAYKPSPNIVPFKLGLTQNIRCLIYCGSLFLLRVPNKPMRRYIDRRHNNAAHAYR